MSDGGLSAAVIEQLLAFVEATSDLVGVVDEESRVLYLNEAARKRLGVGDAADLTTADLFAPEAFARYYAEIRPALLRTGTWHGEVAVRTESGAAVPMTMTVVATLGAGGEVTSLVTHGREVEPVTASTLPVADALTGLLGRSVLDDRIRVALAHAARDGHRLALVVVDVDGMRELNDSFGIAAGDVALQVLARALLQSVRAGDTVARVGGDELAVLVDGFDEHETAEELGRRFRDALSPTPVETRSGAFDVTVSTGVAVALADDTAEELTRRAIAAVRRASATATRGAIACDDGTDAAGLSLADELAVAVSHGFIRPHVQPVVDLQRGVLAGYQGTARWEHARRGLLAAEEFVDAVAHTPIMPVVDLAVLRRTVAAAVRTARNGLHVRAYGHLSRRLAADPDLVRYLAEIVGELGVAPSDLCVEIGHSHLARSSRTVARTLRDLREIGVRSVLSGVDGECEVNELVEPGFDELRLSRRLVRDSEHDDARRRVAHGTIALARAVGLTVIAVGIETDDDRVRMRDAGCDYGQGNLFGAAQPAGTVD